MSFGRLERGKIKWHAAVPVVVGSCIKPIKFQAGIWLANGPTYPHFIHFYYIVYHFDMNTYTLNLYWKNNMDIDLSCSYYFTYYSFIRIILPFAHNKIFDLLEIIEGWTETTERITGESSKNSWKSIPTAK